MGTCLDDVSLTVSRSSPFVNSVRSDVDPLMMFQGEFFQNYFLCKQFEPDQAKHNNVRPRSTSTPCADPNGGKGRGQRTPS